LVFHGGHGTKSGLESFTTSIEFEMNCVYARGPKVGNLFAEGQYMFLERMALLINE
jgi:hypothetical protein